MTHTGILAGAKWVTILIVLGLLVPAHDMTAAQKKKKKDQELVTQTLALPVEPPAVATGEARRLVFQTVPLAAKGLLSQQTREGLKTALKMAGGAPLIHIRAFVAGSGDLRRVPQLVSELFEDKKVRLPSVSVVQVGALPLENAQIAIEFVSAGKKDVNPDGLDFLGTDTFVENVAGATSKPLFEKAVGNLLERMASRSPLAVTCFVSSLQNAGEMTSMLATKFPGAAKTLVQAQRAPYQTYATCQGAVRGGGSGAAVLAFSGTRVASAENQTAITMQRLDRDFSEAGAPSGSALFTNIYGLLPQAAEAARKLRAGEVTVVPVESVASVQAAFAIDSVAGVSK